MNFLSERTILPIQLELVQQVKRRCMKIYHSDCLHILKNMESQSIDSIVTDPPYGIHILNKKWDKSLPSKEIWRECHRVLKPGGYILAFSSARLYHHMATLMEKSGFETQNMLAWLYGDGLAKGKNLSLEIDRIDGIRGLSKPDEKFRQYLRLAIKKSNYTRQDLEKMCDTKCMMGHYLNASQPFFPTYKNWQILKKALKLDNTYDAFFEKRKKTRKKVQSKGKGHNKGKYFHSFFLEYEKYQSKTSLSKKWEGWKYGKMTLRPCMEPIYFGQKTPIRPVPINIKSYGIGAINLKDCKVIGRDGKSRAPGNVMHDGSNHVVDSLEKGSAVAPSSINEFSFEETDSLEAPFFFVSKPGFHEKKDNPHPTIKPLRLMRHLVRLVTPPRGICLDPFLGSGTTGVACHMEGMDFIGIEKQRKYYEIARKRLGIF